MQKILQLVGREILIWFRRLVFISLFLSLLISLDKSYLMTDLASHFRLQYTFVGFLGFFICILTRSKYSLLASTVVLALNLPLIWPYMSSSALDSSPPSGKRLTLAMANVRTQNTNYTSFTSLLGTESPDVAIILEVDSEWTRELKRGLEKYPHQKFYPRPDNFGTES